MSTSKPFTSDNPEITQLVDWAMKNFVSREESQRTILKEMEPGKEYLRDARQSNGELRYRIYEDSKGKYMQLCVKHNDIIFPIAAFKANAIQFRMIENDTIIDDNITLGDTYAIYFGDPDTDDSWRIIRDGNNLVIDRRESGSWVTKDTITP